MGKGQVRRTKNSNDVNTLLQAERAARAARRVYPWIRSGYEDTSWYSDSEPVLIFDLELRDALDLEALRPPFFDFQLQVLTACLRALERKSASGLWDEVLALMTEAFSRERVRFLLEMGWLYTGRQAGRASTAERFLSPGGLTALLEYVMFCESELTVGTRATARRLLEPLLARNAVGGWGIDAKDYWSAFGTADQQVLDTAIAQVGPLFEREQQLQREFVATVNASIRVRVLRNGSGGNASTVKVETSI